MITGKELRALAAEAESTIDHHVEAVCAKAEAAARLGHIKVHLDHYSRQDDPFFVETHLYRTPEPTKIQQLVIEKLKAIGIYMTVVPYTYQVGGGLGSMSDEPPHDETGYRFVVSW